MSLLAMVDATPKHRTSGPVGIEPLGDRKPDRLAVLHASRPTPFIRNHRGASFVYAPRMGYADMVLRAALASRFVGTAVIRPTVSDSSLRSSSDMSQPAALMPDPPGACRRWWQAVRQSAGAARRESPN